MKQGITIALTLTAIILVVGLVFKQMGIKISDKG